MGKYKYKLTTEVKPQIGDIDYSDIAKSTVSDVNPETGAITWKIEYIPNLEKLFDSLVELVKVSKNVASKIKDDPKFFEILSTSRDLFNKTRTHLRKNYPQEYKQIQSKLNELSTTGGAGSYLSKYAFKIPKKHKEIKENIGATLGPGPKAGPEGIKDNYYIKKFQYKLVPKDKNGNYVQKGSGLEVKNLF
jgi:hypothetical protein